MIYKRDKSGVEIEWAPDETALGEKAMQSVVEELGVKIGGETAMQVREEYKRLHVNKYGQDSKFYTETE